MERAVAFQQSRQVAVALQSAMLSQPPEVAGCAIEARYLPAAAGLAVGGDWHDAFVLPGGVLGPSAVGTVAHHAALIVDGALAGLQATNALPLELVP